MITPEELIIEMMPFANELKEFCKSNPSFKKALKIIYFDRFITLQVITTSYSPNFPNDEVIGVYVYDYGLKKPQFKQDFIVNKEGKRKEFILFTGLSKVVDNKYVKHVNDFLATYGKDGHYKNAHRPKFDEFTGVLKVRAIKAINLAEKRRNDGYIKITPEYAEEIFQQLKIMKPDISTPGIENKRDNTNV